MFKTILMNIKTNKNDKINKHLNTKKLFDKIMNTNILK